MVSTAPIKADVLAECRDDFVGLWSVLRDVRGRLPSASPMEIRQTTLDVLEDLLRSGAVVAGAPSDDGSRFVPWRVDPDAAIARIDSQWRTLGRDPDIGEVAWFTAMDSDD